MPASGDVVGAGENPGWELGRGVSPPAGDDVGPVAEPPGDGEVGVALTGVGVA